jgi:NAD(P)H-hydrate epimerase
MENAGRGVVEYLLSCKIQGNIVVCCGKGNNAGDGFVIARHLDNLGLSPLVLLFADPHDLKGDAKINYDIVVKSRLPIIIEKQNFSTDIADLISRADWIIDAIFGTGLSGTVKPPYDAVIQAINSSRAEIIAVDIPSGLDCDTGKLLGIAVIAKSTVTFTCNKKGFFDAEAKKYLGDVHIVDIGIPKVLLNEYK